MPLSAARNGDDDGVTQPLLANRSADDGQRPAPAAEAETGRAAPAAGTFRRNLGTIDAFAIVISIVIGSGVFTSPGSIDTNVSSPGAALIVWLVGGILAWTGASTMAELGTAIPGEGRPPALGPSCHCLDTLPTCR